MEVVNSYGPLYNNWEYKMFATVTIGDSTLIINERRKHPQDNSHMCTCLDSWDNTSSLREVASEIDAIAVMQGFLNMDGPAGKFAELFPAHVA